MPELPEVETVRRGLDPIVTGRRVQSATVYRLRTLRRQPEGADAFTAWLTGARIEAVHRRGKYLWWALADAQRPVMVAHLGMSGQFRVAAAAGQAPPVAQERVRFVLDDGAVVSFLDQRTFGWLHADEAQAGVPRSVAHIALDPFDPAFDLDAAAVALRSRRTGVKAALLDQTVVSGIGNIYADETLWRVGMHFRRATDSLSRGQARAVLEAAADVMGEALAAGGTSFDPLYVDVNGESGWFARDLAVYGRAGEPCRRCGSLIVREAFANRSSHRCPHCQRPPRSRRPRAAA